MAAERLGIPWVELSPHPLYSPSRGLPPIGSGLAPGVGIRGRLRDTLMRAATGRSIKQGLAQRSQARVGVGLPALDPGPQARLIATLPALEVPRPDWPECAHVVGPLLWEPTEVILDPPPGDEPLVMVAPSTAHTGAVGMFEGTVEGLDGAGVRLIASMLDGAEGQHPDWVRAGLGRQDAMLRDASVLVCGGGHGMLAKALLAGVPTVVVPGGGGPVGVGQSRCAGRHVGDDRAARRCSVDSRCGTAGALRRTIRGSCEVCCRDCVAGHRSSGGVPTGGQRWCDGVSTLRLNAGAPLCGLRWRLCG